MDLGYYKSRLTSAITSAKAAADPCARIAHEKMARAYGVLVDTTSRLQDRAEFPKLRKARQRELDTALDDWENEGGHGQDKPKQPDHSA